MSPVSSGGDMLRGLPASSTFTLYPPVAHMRSDEASAFFQDNWRVSSRLTLNLGVRWEVRRPLYDINGQTSAFDATRARIVVASPGGQVSSQVYPALYNAYK